MSQKALRAQEREERKRIRKRDRGNRKWLRSQERFLSKRMTRAEISSVILAEAYTLRQECSHSVDSAEYAVSVGLERLAKRFIGQ